MESGAIKRLPHLRRYICVLWPSSDHDEVRSQNDTNLIYSTSKEGEKKLSREHEKGKEDVNHGE